ncbi:flagellar protein export ATPase FliI [Mesorhizobium sp. J428]|uniref:flagellar protein export ATPase FliI n=1 Tax=Mesorhizobium sp. J428 TaxID=2898440 RepID=UPI002150D4CA|nr:flagellar protein export ATPase FliI [Mesorhizobium sp. J428]MCR5855849.1 flagellar protein export ATPase FliI [Mesorhizobium sp. J428]
MARFTAPDALMHTGGRVVEVSATHYRVRGLSRKACIGDVVEHEGPKGRRAGEIVRVTPDDVLVSPFETTADLAIDTPVFNRGPLAVRPDQSWRGRVVNALGHPIDGGPPVGHGEQTGGHAVSAMSRQRVEAAFKTGVRVIDIFTPLCFGQRMGVFAGSGVGKSTLLAMLAAADSFDTAVISLVGERGREVREFLEDTVGPKNMAKTVAVVSTSDESAMMRRRAPATAMSVAEYFRDRGDRVLLIVDSVTRFAHALREVATAAGEPPIARGYPASVFTELPKLLERAGPGTAGETGSITAIISVLVDGDDHNDPIADSVRGILDGHVVLDRSIAEQGRFPAVNPLASISRLSGRAWSGDEKTLVARLKAMISRFEETRDIRLLGAYAPGSDPELDLAVRQVPLIYEALGQSPGDPRTKDPFADLARHLKAREAQNGQQAA